jgi:hypothetical protein
MTDDTLVVLKAITDLTKVCEAYHGEFREFRGVTETKVAALEDDAKSSRTWQKIQAVCVLPVVGVIHQVAEHFHWIK